MKSGLSLDSLTEENASYSFHVQSLKPTSLRPAPTMQPDSQWWMQGAIKIERQGGGRRLVAGTRCLAGGWRLEGLGFLMPVAAQAGSQLGLLSEGRRGLAAGIKLGVNRGV